MRLKFSRQVKFMNLRKIILLSNHVIIISALVNYKYEKELRMKLHLFQKYGVK